MERLSSSDKTLPKDRSRSSLRKAQSGSDGVSSFESLVEQSFGTHAFIDDLNASEPIESSLESAMDNVFILGERLKSDPGLKGLKEYKRAVKTFLDGILKKAYKQSTVLGIANPRMGFMKKEFSVIRVVDENLDKLALAVLSEQRDLLGVLARVDEIKGILVDYLR